MTRNERQQQAHDTIALCERVGTRLLALGEIHSLPDSRLAQLFSGDELVAAKWLRYVAKWNKKKGKLA